MDTEAHEDACGACDDLWLHPGLRTVCEVDLSPLHCNGHTKQLEAVRSLSEADEAVGPVGIHDADVVAGDSRIVGIWGRDEQ